MAGEIIRQGDSTSHGGTVLEGSMADICHGKPIAYLGHKVHCPKCKGDFLIVEGVMTTTFYGKGVAVAGMKTSCGAVLVASQFTDTVAFAGGSGHGANAGGSAAQAGGGPARQGDRPLPRHPNEKAVTRLFWTYGSAEEPVADIARHYVDLNLHVESVNYGAGEHALIVVENDDGSELVPGTAKLELQARISADGTCKFMNVFNNQTVQIGTIG